MIAGNIPGKTATISQQIAMVLQDGNYEKATIWSLIVLLIAFIVIVLMNLIIGKKAQSGKKW